MKIGQVFDPRNNALNAWRLILATGVILLHAHLFTKQHLPEIHQFLRDGWVDGFFAISGFLITGSWLKKSKTRIYFAARALRILQAYGHVSSSPHSSSPPQPAPLVCHPKSDTSSRTAHSCLYRGHRPGLLT